MSIHELFPEESPEPSQSDIVRAEHGNPNSDNANPDINTHSSATTHVDKIDDEPLDAQDSPASGRTNQDRLGRSRRETPHSETAPQAPGYDQTDTETRSENMTAVELIKYARKNPAAPFPGRASASADPVTDATAGPTSKEERGDEAHGTAPSFATPPTELSTNQVLADSEADTEERAEKRFHGVLGEAKTFFFGNWTNRVVTMLAASAAAAALIPDDIGKKNTPEPPPRTDPALAAPPSVVNAPLKISRTGTNAKNCLPHGSTDPADAFEFGAKKAWRCSPPYNADGLTLIAELAQSSLVTSFVLTPGDDTTDRDGRDQWSTSRCVTSIRLTFDDGSFTDKDLDCARRPQTVTFPPKATKTMRIYVRRTQNPTPESAKPAENTTGESDDTRDPLAGLFGQNNNQEPGLGSDLPGMGTPSDQARNDKIDRFAITSIRIVGHTAR